MPGTAGSRPIHRQNTADARQWARLHALRHGRPWAQTRQMVAGDESVLDSRGGLLDTGFIARRPETQTITCTGLLNRNARTLDERQSI